MIPTRDRHRQLRTAVASALGQDLDVEVIVVDDGSTEIVDLSPDPRLTVLRHHHSQGSSCARNVGAAKARTRWVTWLDDDDELLPQAARISLQAIQESHLPPPIAAISGLVVIGSEGRELERRLPPRAMPRGSHFWLEQRVVGSYYTKQTLVMERELFLRLGGYDPAFGSRVHSEFFLRLNAACSLAGIPEVTYRHNAHSGPRLSNDPHLRQRSFAMLVDKHQDLLRSHPAGYAAFLLEHARTSWYIGQRGPAACAVLRAARVAPAGTARRGLKAVRATPGLLLRTLGGRFART
ncbi:MAG: glycosyltransferase family 2 protein [Ornithinimicrobium sp.]